MGIWVGRRLLLLIGLLSFGACTRGANKEAIVTRTSALTATQQQILGFETSGAWSSPSGPVTTLSTLHTEGAKSLAVKPKGYVPYTSLKLASLGEVGGSILYDLMLPTQQANPFWFGASQLYFSIPSMNLNNVYVGQVELTGLPLAKWTTLSFGLTPSMSAALRGSYSDLTFTIVLNVPSNATGQYLLDNVRFPIVCPPATSTGTGGTSGATGCGTSVSLTASKTYSPVAWNDADQTFPAPTAFTIPGTLLVTDGSAGNGPASLELRQGTKSVFCSYAGGSSVSHPITPEDQAFGQYYIFKACASCGLKAGDVVSVDGLHLRVDDGDSQSGPTIVSTVANCEEGTVPTQPAGSDVISEIGDAPPLSPRDPTPLPASELNFPDPFLGQSNPEDANGNFTPFVHPDTLIIDVLQ